MDSPHPFTLTTPDGALEALRDRLRGARWPEPLLDGAGWDLVAIHRTDVGLPLLQVDPSELTDEERAYLADVDRWRAAEGAYRGG